MRAGVLLAAALAASTLGGCTIDYGPPDPTGVLIRNETGEPVRIVLVYANGDVTDIGTIEGDRTLDLGPGDLARPRQDTIEFADRLEAREPGSPGTVVEDFPVTADTDPQIAWRIDGEPDPPPDTAS
jgi:hypothetical protein